MPYGPQGDCSRTAFLFFIGFIQNTQGSRVVTADVIQYKLLRKSI